MVTTRSQPRKPQPEPQKSFKPNPENDQKQNLAMENFTKMVMRIAAEHQKLPLSAAQRSRIEKALAEKSRILTHTPNHPPYCAMISRAIQELNEVSGSNEESISNFIRKNYPDLPWAHSTYLKHHLRKLCDSKLIVMTSERCYVLVDGTNPLKSNATEVQDQPKEETGMENVEIAGRQDVLEEGDTINRPDPDQSTNSSTEMKQRVKRGSPSKFDTVQLPDRPKEETFTGCFDTVVTEEQNEVAEESHLSTNEQGHMRRGRGRMPLKPESGTTYQQCQNENMPLKRGRGRPPKRKSEAVSTTSLILDAIQHHPQQLEQVKCRGQGRSR